MRSPPDRTTRGESVEVETKGRTGRGRHPMEGPKRREEQARPIARLAIEAPHRTPAWLAWYERLT